MKKDNFLTHIRFFLHNGFYNVTMRETIVSCTKEECKLSKKLLLIF